jgi:hypothetical protein
MRHDNVKMPVKLLVSESRMRMRRERLKQLVEEQQRPRYANRPPQVECIEELVVRKKLHMTLRNHSLHIVT